MPQNIFLKKETKHSNKFMLSNPRNVTPLSMCAQLLVKTIRGIKDKVFLASRIQKVNQARKVSKLVLKSKLIKSTHMCRKEQSAIM